jgi:hypothetical protein
MKTDHPLTQDQIAVTLILLEKLNQVIEEKKDNDIIYQDIKVLGSDYTRDIFIHFEKIIMKTEPDPDTIYWKISPDGTLDDDALHNMEFESMSDKVHFFNQLFEIRIV